MKLTNGEIFEAKMALDKLIEKELPVLTSYKLAQIGLKINEQAGIIENVRNGLIRKYGEKDKDNPQGLRVKEGTENFTKFVEEFNELMMQEVEVVIEKIEIPAGELTIEPKTLMPLVKLIEVK
uniref:Uncharacterized protein n=1 Tax=viral metagenome TaxID=1070528 RepID=A0A6M3IG16_9ZZZZ